MSLAGNLGLVELSACSRQLVDACRSAAEGDISKRVRELNEAAERALARLEPLLTLGEMSVISTATDERVIGREARVALRSVAGGPARRPRDRAPSRPTAAR